MKFTDTQTFAAIIGGLIGIIPSFCITIYYEKFKKKADEKQNYHAWLNGLQAEVNHIKSCIAEIIGYLNNRMIPTKRLNSDFIEKARLILFSYNQDITFLEILTTAYRDIVHTNEMLNRLEEKAKINDSNYIHFMKNVYASMTGVNSSLLNLEEKIKAIKIKKNKES